MKESAPYTLKNFYEMIQQLQAKLRDKDKEISAILVRLKSLEDINKTVDYLEYC